MHMTAWQGQLVEDFLKCSGIDRDRVVQIQGSHIDQANAILEWGKTISALKHHAYLIVGCKSHFLSQTTRSLAAEFGESGIRFNAIAIDQIANHRDLLGIAKFLLSEESSYVTGMTLSPQSTHHKD